MTAQDLSQRYILLVNRDARHAASSVLEDIRALPPEEKENLLEDETFVDAVLEHARLLLVGPVIEDPDSVVEEIGGAFGCR